MTEMISMPPRHGKVYAARKQLEEKIVQTRQEIRTAGPVHRRDLQKSLKRMTAQLRQYDAFQAAAQRKVG